MSRLTRFLNFFRINKSIAIDLGTSNVLIYDKQKNKIVLNEPSVIVKDRKTGKLIAVGKKAKEMQGKTAVTSVVIRPLREGVISDIDATREMLSAFITHLILLCLIFSFNIFILKVDYGQNLPEIIFISILGSIAGISFGLLIGSLIKTSYEIKINLTTFFQLFCCFLSGMMGPSIKYLVDTNFPLINHLNPANMIVDGLYSLQIYDNLNRYNFNIISLILFSTFCLIISVIVIRKQKYAQL